MSADFVSASTNSTHGDRIAGEIGSRLRSLREQRQMSMLDVEQSSSGDIVPSTIGAYERGDRTISLPRLNRLARLYNVPIEHLLPNATGERQAIRSAPIAEPLTINSRRLDGLSGEPFLSLMRFIELIKLQRSDPERHIITLRCADAVVVAAILGAEVEQVVDRLTALNLLSTAS